MNPLRVSLGSASAPNVKIENLPEGSPAKDHPEWAVAYADGRLYFDPGYPGVRQLIADGVREIVENYNVDGVIFDDLCRKFTQSPLILEMCMVSYNKIPMRCIG